MIFCDPAVTISTNLLLIFVCVPHQIKINIMKLDLYCGLSKKKRKKLKTHLGSHRDPAWYTTLQMRNVVFLVIFGF